MVKIVMATAKCSTRKETFIRMIEIKQYNKSHRKLKPTIKKKIPKCSEREKLIRMTKKVLKRNTTN